MNAMEKDEAIRKAANEVLDLISDRHNSTNSKPERSGFDTYFDAEPMEEEAAEIIRRVIRAVLEAT